MYNDKNKKDLRQSLRKTMPKGEQLLWQKLRNKQLGYKFFRQYSIGNIILDFYCPTLYTAIEVDGLTHEAPLIAAQDIQKKIFLENKGITVLRFASNEIFQNINSVAETIYYECKKQDTPSLSQKRGRG